jgi:hypothetical protein
MDTDITFVVNEKGYSFARFMGVRGYLNQNDCKQLIEHAKALPENGRYAETGTFLGCSAHIIAAHSKATVWAHDIWSIDEDENPSEFPSECFFKFYESVKRNKFENRIIPIAGNSLKTIDIHDDDSLDLAFIDGDHSYEGALGDFRNIFPKMKEGSVILAHDCAPKSECLSALNTFAIENNQMFEFLQGTCGMVKIVVNKVTVLNTKSQLYADSWVLTRFPEPGFYVDAGCGEGIDMSNTYELEKRGWKGICIDANPRNFETRNCIVENAVLGSEDGKEVTFVHSEEDPNLSGVLENLKKHEEKVLSSEHTKETRVTQLLGDILDKHGAPQFIEYLNLDVEGAEYDVLSTFPFDKYTFGCLTVEHNFEEPKRTQIRTLLENNGYVYKKAVNWDDWYVRRPLNEESTCTSSDE